MKMTIKKKNLIIALFLVVLFIILLPNKYNHSLTVNEILCFSIIGVISIIEITREVSNRAYSLNLMHYSFIFIFFFIAPLIQISYNYHPWGIEQSDGEIVNSCVLIIIWMIFYKIGNIIVPIILKKDKYKNNRVADDNNKKNDCIHKISKIILLIFAIISFFIIISNIGFINLFARKTAVIDSSSKMEVLLISHCTRAILVFTLAISLIDVFINKKGYLFLIVSSIMLLIACFPTGLARNTAANIYLGILVILLFYKNIFKNKDSLRFIVIFLVGMILLFPMLNAYRRFDFVNINISEVFRATIDNVSENYLSGDYDAFSLINDTKVYTRNNGFSLGRQLIGSILFFIPRKIWPNKPEGSGSLVFTSFGQPYTNISCPLLAEGYINFGIIGVIVFSFIASMITTYIDNLYWKKIIEEGVTFTYLKVLYPFLLPSYFFLLRGDLQSSLAYMMAIIVTFYIMYRVVMLKHFISNEKGSSS